MDERVIFVRHDIVEKDFIHQLIALSDIGTSHSDFRLIISPVKGQRASKELLQAVSDNRNFRRILFHISDEKLRHRGASYREFDSVIKNYFDPRTSWSKKVVTFPLGYLSGFVRKTPTEATSTEYTWSFCGAGKGPRRAVVEMFNHIPRGRTHFTSGWEAADSLSQEEVYDIYSKSAFVLCPPGNSHFDTFRIMEALQAGAIPLCTKFLGRDFLRYTFGKHPLPVARSWKHAVEIVSEYVENPRQLRAKQQEVRKWYSEFHTSLAKYLGELLTGAEINSPFREVIAIQRRARWDVPLVMKVRKSFRPTRARTDSVGHAEQSKKVLE